jgi:hypothetical protein
VREVQSRLSSYLAWTKAESDPVGDSYEDLVKNLKIVAGTACRDAWLAPAAHDDADMNIPPSVVDLSSLKTYEDAYIAATKAHLAGLLRARKLWAKQ